MSNRTRISCHLPLCLLAFALGASAQLQPDRTDPLARIRDAAKSNVQACSATAETLCEQLAPKILANAQGDSPLASNLRGLTEAINKRESGGSAAARAVAWSVAAFHDAGVDVHVENYANPNANPNGGGTEQENVIAEIQGGKNRMNGCW